ncbi:MAG: YicC family protein [Desulfobacteraceae bacterium IS3]|nr:MAG: YicC family protein [Desulfobacteraceae bacterium IS3]HAO21826.1 YicC family protein [Desulfobacteraceae bacterium]
MIRSMTAFSGAEKTLEKLTVSIEIRAYNSRYLDVTLRIPQSYNGLEDRIKSMVSEKIARGRIEIRIQIRDESEEAYRFDIDEPKARAYYQAIVRLKEILGMETPVTLEMMAGINSVIKPADTEKDEDKLLPILQSCMTEAIDGLNAMRKTEGDFIAKDMTERLNHIQACAESIEASSDGLLALYQERLKERISALSGGMVEIDPARIAQEAAFLADRSDISEEIVRIKSHIKQFQAIMDSPEPGGRKLNFLLQEFNREFNTIGSKTTKAQVSHIVVEVKSELEKMREQIQNIE